MLVAESVGRPGWSSSCCPRSAGSQGVCREELVRALDRGAIGQRRNVGDDSDPGTVRGAQPAGQAPGRGLSGDDASCGTPGTSKYDGKVHPHRLGLPATLERQPRTFVRTHGLSVRGSSPSSPRLFRLNRRLGSTQFGPEVVTLWTGQRAGQHTDRNTSRTHPYRRSPAL